jgi:anthranilate phosphoribosyltransferase
MDALEGTRKIISGEATEAQIAAFLIYLEYVDKTPQILAAFTNAILNNTKEIRDCCDIVGTGGDGFNTFNVSTASGVIAAGAGCKVAKVILFFNYSMGIEVLRVIVDLQIY